MNVKEDKTTTPEVKDTSKTNSDKFTWEDGDVQVLQTTKDKDEYAKRNNIKWY